MKIETKILVPRDYLRVTLGPIGQGDTPNLFPHGFSHSPDGPKAPPHGRFHGGFLSYWRSLQSPVINYVIRILLQLSFK